MSKTVSVIEAAGFKVTGGTAISQILKGTVSVTVSALAAAAEEDITVTITGATAGDVVVVTPTNAAMETGLAVVGCFVSAANTVKIRVTNLNAAAALTGSTASWSYLVVR